MHFIVSHKEAIQCEKEIKGAKRNKKKGKPIKLYPLLVLSIHQKISLRYYRKYLLSPVHQRHTLTPSAFQL